jgi:putative FmdB family regulatory protein
MLYEYECDKCETRMERSCPMGKAPKAVKCTSCGGRARRVFSSPAIGIDGRVNKTGGFGEEMKRRNKAARRRQQGIKPPVRTVAHDFGGGDVREV